MSFEKKDDDVGKNTRSLKKDKKAMYKISLIGKGICAIGKEGHKFIAPNISVVEGKSIQLELLESQYIELRNNRSLKIQKIGV